MQEYIGGGGRLAYLGGNGFYWRIATSSDIPDVLEIRRAEGGIRTWAAEPGEYFHALDGAYGGLWRCNGRPPQMLCGIGFSAQGLFEGSYYRCMPDAADPRAAWIFEGIEDEVIGRPSAPIAALFIVPDGSAKLGFRTHYPQIETNLTARGADMDEIFYDVFGINATLAESSSRNARYSLTASVVKKRALQQMLGFYTLCYSVIVLQHFPD